MYVINMATEMTTNNTHQLIVNPFREYGKCFYKGKPSFLGREMNTFFNHGKLVANWQKYEE